MNMNQFEIEAAFHANHECPNVRKGVALLHSLMEAVNAQSDGWAYWRAPSKAAEKLMELLQSAGNISYGTSGYINETDLKKAITPIRSMVTRQRSIQSRYGNKFDFDCELA